MIIGVRNLSTLVSAQDAYDMALLVNRQARDHVAPAWGMLPPTVRYLASSVKPQYHVDAEIAILDDADQAGDLGWHTEDSGGVVYGRVFARPVLGNGGNALTANLSVCSVLSHEVIEVLGDAACDAWRQRADGTLIAQELCDPVEGDSYQVRILSNISGTVSDFALPAWFDPGAPAERSGYQGMLGFDWMGMVHGPFEVRPSGYVIEMSGGTATAQWGEQYPAGERAGREAPGPRTPRRAAAGARF